MQVIEELTTAVSRAAAIGDGTHLLGTERDDMMENSAGLDDVRQVCTRCLPTPTSPANSTRALLMAKEPAKCKRAILTAKEPY
jgi:hypothetical protein